MLIRSRHHSLLIPRFTYSDTVVVMTAVASIAVDTPEATATERPDWKAYGAAVHSTPTACPRLFLVRTLSYVNQYRTQRRRRRSYTMQADDLSAIKTAIGTARSTFHSGIRKRLVLRFDSAGLGDVSMHVKNSGGQTILSQSLEVRVNSAESSVVFDKFDWFDARLTVPLPSLSSQPTATELAAAVARLPAPYSLTIVMNGLEFPIPLIAARQTALVNRRAKTLTFQLVPTQAAIALADDSDGADSRIRGSLEWQYTLDEAFMPPSHKPPVPVVVYTAPTPHQHINYKYRPTHESHEYRLLISRVASSGAGLYAERGGGRSDPSTFYEWRDNTRCPFQKCVCGRAMEFDSYAGLIVHFRCCHPLLDIEVTVRVVLCCVVLRSHRARPLDRLHSESLLCVLCVMVVYCS